MRRPVALVLALSLAAGGATASAAPRVNVTPQRALLDAPFGVRVTGLSAGEPVQLHVREAAFPRGTLTLTRAVKADSRGVVDLPDSKLLALVTPAAGGPTRISPRFESTIAVSVEAGGRTLATTRASRFVASPSVATRQLRPPSTGLYGEYQRPAAASKHTAVLLLGGSEGGVPSGYAESLLASHGYPVLALAYFAEPGLPSSLERVPLEYFRRALAWLAAQPEVDPGRIVLIGSSRGGEAALLVGATYPELVHAVAAYVPSATVVPSPTDGTTPAWTLAGKPLVTGQAIEVEKIAGPVFAVGAAQDGLWRSSSSVFDVQQRLDEHGRSDVTALQYRFAGHSVGFMVPNVPTVTSVHSPYGVLYLGGSPLADANARADSWPKLLRFLARL